MNDTLTLFDQYVMLGLKLKADGRIKCMFCERYSRPGPDGIPVMKHSSVDCPALRLYIIDPNLPIPRRGT